ncbi:hypothetical protein [Mumia sp. DW29H23]|uniref:hypothetical protein n=1 Tax=Mumia sp. DW29H23 TaxID=3421241 RepID=UPI003D6942AF
MTRRLPLAVLVAVATLVLGGCGHSWDWKQADLDRNRLNLGLFRGADTGEKLGSWVRVGEVVDSKGSRSSDDLEVVVRYEREVGEPFGTPGTERVCYRFTPATDGAEVDFGRTDCP